MKLKICTIASSEKCAITLAGLVLQLTNNRRSEARGVARRDGSPPPLSERTARAQPGYLDAVSLLRLPVSTSCCFSSVNNPQRVCRMPPSSCSASSPAVPCSGPPPSTSFPIPEVLASVRVSLRGSGTPSSSAWEASRPGNWNSER